MTSCALVRLFGAGMSLGWGAATLDCQLMSHYELVLTTCCFGMTRQHVLARAWDDWSAEA